MAMQTKAWMIATLFSHWISHFIQCLERKGGISHEKRHLPILDGHNSHVTLEVVQKCREVGLDLLTLPGHTSHRLQSLDVGVFVPFKRYFKRYRDAWSISNKGKGASKQTLAMWMAKALERALTTRNITAGFCTTGIYPLNSEAVNAHMGPARQFASFPSTVQQGISLGGREGSSASSGGRAAPAPKDRQRRSLGRAQMGVGAMKMVTLELTPSAPEPPMLCYSKCVGT